MNRNACVAVFMLLASAASAFAQDASAPAADPAAPKGQAHIERQPRRWEFSWDERPRVSYGDLVRIDLRARFVTDLRGADAPLTQTETSRFDIARRRIGMSGVLADVADFQVEREFADEGGWRDVYLNYRQLEALNVQGGRFKIPFGLDENTSSTNLDFVYRSRVATLSPGRDRGVMAHGRLGILHYFGGLFLRDGDNGRGQAAADAATSRTSAGRLLVQPFRSSKSALEDIQAGVAFTSSDVREGVTDIAGFTSLREPFFRPEFAVQGMRRRLGLEARWRPGPFAVQSELVRVTSERRGQSIENTDLPMLTALAWYAHGTWVLTGEKKAKGTDEPTHPLFHGGFGSVELATRFESVRFSSPGTGEPTTGPRAENIVPHHDDATTFGVNWSPNRWVRLQVNATRHTMAIATPSSFWSRVVRFRFAL